MRHLCIFGIIFLFTASVYAQDDDSPSQPPALQNRRGEHRSEGNTSQDFISRARDRAVVLDINASLIGQDQQISWNESHRKTTIPGRPVGIKMVGANIAVVVQFTPYLRRNTQKFLVVQGQIWVDDPDQGIRYFTSIQTLPLDFGEPIYFFPLGPSSDNNTENIEIMITMFPYEEN